VNELFFGCEPEQLPCGRRGVIPVLLYGRRPPRPGMTSIGGPVIDAVRRLGILAHQRAFDFLTISMAVTAADTFVDRRIAPDGWTRELWLRLPLYEPGPWQSNIPRLEEALRFLSGDSWKIDVHANGPARPIPQVRGRLTNILKHDCVSLFSGGLDSTIGALDLLSSGSRPLLVSHAYRSDAQRQRLVHRKLPETVSRFAAVANPRSLRNDLNDVQMRTRSFNFLALGVLAAATMAEHGQGAAPVDLFVPENGLIALNPPLTYRRIGSLSTRTTHPHFLGLMQQILDGIGIPVRIVNPYALKTKGEMLRACSDERTLGLVSRHTVSCGKWKRTGIQCGRCVPCIIRRASFHAAKVPDRTSYASAGRNLQAVIASEKDRDDLLAMVLAAKRLSSVDFARWVSHAGPLPAERSIRDPLLAVAKRGMQEVSEYLNHLGLLL